MEHPTLWDVYRASHTVGRVQSIPHCGTCTEHPTLWDVYRASHTVGHVQSIPHCGTCTEHPTLWDVYRASHTVGRVQSIPHCGTCTEHPTLWDVYRASHTVGQSEKVHQLTSWHSIILYLLVGSVNSMTKSLVAGVTMSASQILKSLLHQQMQFAPSDLTQSPNKSNFTQQTYTMAWPSQSTCSKSPEWK